MVHARINDQLAVRLHYAGLHDTALAAAQDAHTAWRQLAWADPDAYEPGLAAALSRLGVQSSDVGRWAEALAAEQDAVAVFRKLAVFTTGNPTAYQLDLAISLTNLGIWLL
ncbi:hypothetical protein [Kitasatospora purpeofusca]|uniref:hypothetical protein n=1 Tax=Kitasatospora purpeofusca TaxID=67352 RepID=UPI0036D2C1C3